MPRVLPKGCKFCCDVWQRQTELNLVLLLIFIHTNPSEQYSCVKHEIRAEEITCSSNRGSTFSWCISSPVTSCSPTHVPGKWQCATPSTTYMYNDHLKDQCNYCSTIWFSLPVKAPTACTIPVPTQKVQSFQHSSSLWLPEPTSCCRDTDAWNTCVPCGTLPLSKSSSYTGYFFSDISNPPTACTTTQPTWRPSWNTSECAM